MTGAERIAAERTRQITEENWTPEHDATHVNKELAHAAITYLCDYTCVESDCWPWDDWWKPSNPIKDLVKAGALIAAEIDRLSAIESQDQTSCPL